MHTKFLSAAVKRKRDKLNKDAEKEESEITHTPAPVGRPRKRLSESVRSRSPSPVRTPNARRDSRRSLKTRDFDIDNVVVPCTPHVVIPVFQPREIFTPTWRSVSLPVITKDILFFLFSAFFLLYLLIIIFDFSHVREGDHLRMQQQ